MNCVIIGEKPSQFAKSGEHGHSFIVLIQVMIDKYSDTIN
jgi:hypothetical protein